MAISDEQIDAWKTTLSWVRAAARDVADTHGQVTALLEYAPPFIYRRSDLILIADDTVLVIEVKSGTSESVGSARKLVLEYASDIYNFLPVGVDRRVVPIVVRSRAPERHGPLAPIHDHDMRHTEVAQIRPGHLAAAIRTTKNPRQPLKPGASTDWLYRPRASIVQFAQTMFAVADREEVFASLSNGDEIDRLLARVRSIISDAQATRSHRVIAITGRPGAGKTLVGLQIAHDLNESLNLGQNVSPPMYLSGNGPLVDVLTEAIARASRSAKIDQGIRVDMSHERGAAATHIRALRAVLATDFKIETPVIVFDEAQRAWNAQHMKRKRPRAEAGSQPAEILKRMSQLPWAVVICLVGTEQNINSGEEGMKTWIDAVSDSREAKIRWTLHAPAEEFGQVPHVVPDDNLTLKTDLRAAGAAALNEWVDELLRGHIAGAAKIRSTFPGYPLYVTRDLTAAKQWLRTSSRWTLQTAGLVASSSSARLHLYGVDVAASAGEAFDAPAWYLDPLPSLKSCLALERAATEYACQGLELDRVGVCWSWDLQYDGDSWKANDLNPKTARWRPTRHVSEYLVNAYRVLLTRSRAGMVIWVPVGEAEDPTRPIGTMNHTYATLIAAGCHPLP